MKSVSGIMLVFLLLGTLTLTFNIHQVKAQQQTWTVDDDGGADFMRIQDAINAASSGDTIFVYNGTYYEHITLNKSLMLVGEDKRTTIIDGSLNGTAITVVADNVKISEFTIQNGYEGINIQLSDGNTISHNNITLSEFEGLVLEDSKGNIVNDNIVSFNGWDGVYMYNTSAVALFNNVITFNNSSGVFMEASYNNTMEYSLLGNNTFFGIRLDDSNEISIVGNIVSWNELAGISFFNLTGSNFCSNNFLNNTEQVRSDDSPNAWDNGVEGNYWGNYNGTDFYSGLSKNETGSDGIGDSPYFIDVNNQDNYPLIGPVRSFDAGTWNGAHESVKVASNSTVSKFSLNRVDKSISFNVSGATGLGFCRVTIPNVIVQELWQGEYEVLVDGEASLILHSWVYGPYTYIYFTYLHSEHVVIIRKSDMTPPNILILAPENKTYAIRDIPLTFSVSEATSWIGHCLDGQMNVTISSNITIVGLSDGVHTIEVYANDTAGNMGHSEAVYFTVDTVAPTIAILSPENVTYTTSPVSLSFTIDETTSWIGYSLDNQENITIAGNTTLSVLSNGPHSLTVYASDMAGNTGASEKIYFTLEAQQEEAFPTLLVAVIIVLAVLGAALLIYFTKVKKTAKKAE